MPSMIKLLQINKHQVKNALTGEIHAKGTTEKKGGDQVKLIQ
jgi:hypothetical protein